ncbi:MAG: hypothetical protein Kow0037_20550 [Calditrichia bacterium]
MKHHNKKLIDELCDYLGEDLENPMCQELLEHVQQCDSCREYIESIKITVSVCKETAKPEPLPEELKNNLLKTLKEKKRSRT